VPVAALNAGLGTSDDIYLSNRRREETLSRSDFDMTGFVSLAATGKEVVIIDVLVTAKKLKIQLNQEEIFRITDICRGLSPWL